MEVCNYQHDEVVHTERRCPMCELIYEKEKLEAKIEDLEFTVEELNKQIEKLDTI